MKSLPQGPPAPEVPSCSPELLERIINVIADPVFVKDRKHRWLLLNDACCALIGRRREELLGKSDYDYFPREQADVFWAKDEAVFTTGEDNVNEEEITDAQGATHTIITRKSRYVDDRGNLLLLGVIRSISDRDRTAKELMFKTGLLEAQSEASPEGILVIGADNKPISYNGRFLQMWGISPEDAAANSHQRLVQAGMELAADPQAFLAGVRYLYEHPEISRREEILLRDGRTLERYSRPISSRTGAHLGRVTFFRDITERKKTEEELLFKTSLLTAQAESSLEGILVVDPAGRILSYNHRFAELWGIPPDVLASRSDERALRSVLGQLADPEGFLARVQYLYEHRDEQSHEEITLRDGRVFDRYSTPVFSDGGRYHGRVWYFRDVTPEKKAEEILRRQREDLSRSNSELEMFASAASHDLQDPLHKIIAFSDLLKKLAGEALPESAKDILSRIRVSADRMSKLIEGLLDLSKVMRDTRPFELVDLNAVVSGVLSDLETRISQYDARVDVGPLPVLPAHPIQMRQLMQNLIANALKFRRKDESPRVTVSSRTLPSGEAEITIADNGIGFNEKHRERIFEPFVRLHARSEYEGHGVGLATCRRIVQRHGGSITAVGEPRKGSKFIITLPQRRPS